MTTILYIAFGIFAITVLLLWFVLAATAFAGFLSFIIGFPVWATVDCVRSSSLTPRERSLWLSIIAGPWAVWITSMVLRPVWDNPATRSLVSLLLLLSMLAALGYASRFGALHTKKWALATITIPFLIFGPMIWETRRTTAGGLKNYEALRVGMDIREIQIPWTPPGRMSFISCGGMSIAKTIHFDEWSDFVKQAPLPEACRTMTFFNFGRFTPWRTTYQVDFDSSWRIEKIGERKVYD